MKKEEDLKKCPFCGGPARMIENYSDKYDMYFMLVKCMDCGGQTRAFSSNRYDEEFVTRAWNRRSEEK